MKRTFWAMIGAGFGFGMSFWTMRALRRAADRWLPAPLVDRLRRALDGLDGGTSARDATPAAEVPPWRTGTTHPSTGGLRALAGGRRGAGR